jgi:hypothetical protein
MSTDPTSLGPFEILGLLASADRETIERRADALSALLRLGLAPPEGDAVALPDGQARTPEAVAEAARTLREPKRWLREVLLWPDGEVSENALDSAADLLEGAAGRPADPASLLRQLAHQYMADELARQVEIDQPERWISKRLDPPAHPPLYLGPSPIATGPRTGA